MLEQAEIYPYGVKIVKVAEFPTHDDLFELFHRRMIDECVVHQQDQAFLIG